MKRIFLSILITAIIVIILLSQISLQSLYALLKTIDPLWAVLGSMAYLLAILFRALRFKWLIYSKGVPFSHLFRVTAFYHLSLMVLPSKIGELSYPYFLNKITGMSITEGLASLIASRVYDFFIVLIIFLSFSIGFQSFLRINPISIILLVALLIGFIFLAFFYMSNFLNLLTNALGKISKSMGLQNIKSFLWIQRKMNEIAEDFYAIKARKTYLPVSLTSMASWGMIFWTFYAFLKGFGVNIPLTKMVFGSTMAVITNALPISGIGNWGTLEVGWAAGFLIVGLDREKAIASGFGVHIIIFIVCALISFFCWVLFKKYESPTPPSP